MPFSYKFTAAMTCESCANCIKKVLDKNKEKGVGIADYNIDLGNKAVTVSGTVTKEEITSILQKTGIEIELVSSSSTSD